MKNIFLVLTPQAVDPARPFPYISNLSLNIGLTVQSNPEDTLAGAPVGHEVRFVRIKVPPVVPRLIPVSEGKLKFALVEEVIEANKDECLFQLTGIKEYNVLSSNDQTNKVLVVSKNSFQELNTAVFLQINLKEVFVKDLETSCFLPSAILSV